jgi:hypothetical protein
MHIDRGSCAGRCRDAGRRPEGDEQQPEKKYAQKSERGLAI